MKKINLLFLVFYSWINITSAQTNLLLEAEDNAAASITATASGLWCYQGGSPADITFKESFAAGNNSLRFYNAPIIDKIVITSDTSARQSDAFYVSSSTGDDDNDGLSPTTAWQSLTKVNGLSLVPGDSLLFKAADTFIGKMTFQNESGTEALPIMISSYWIKSSRISLD